MALTSITFILIMLLSGAVYYFCNGKIRKILLAIANILFYLSYDLNSWIYLLIAVICTFYVGYLASKNLSKSKKIIGLSIAGLVLCLFIFKYLNFFIGSFMNNMTFSIVAPIGISFTTFKMIGYLMDIYRQKMKPCTNFLNYFIYVTFFAQLVSGPIERADHFLPQLSKLNRRFSYDELKSGLFRFAIGAFEKVVIADRLGMIVNQIYGNQASYGPQYLVLAMILYTFEIYCDFDGYSSMAIGLAHLFGFNTIENFKAPYLAKNPSDFWRRWHISLSSWFKDYVYIPLGGNQKGSVKRYVNIMIVSLLSGLWHGAAMSFVIWGFLHGVIQVIADVFRKLHQKFTSPLPWLTKAISIAITFIVIMNLWVFFRVGNVIEALTVITSIFHVTSWNIDPTLLNVEAGDLILDFILIGLVILIDIFRNKISVIKTFNKLPSIIRWLVYIMLIVGFILFAVYGPGYDPGNFIYQQF